MKAPLPQLLRVAFCLAFGLAGAIAQDNLPPNEPFQTVHLLTVTSPDGEKALLSAMADYNAAIVKAGCASCVYHLWKVNGTQAGNYNYLWISSWPGRDMSADYNAAAKKHADLDSIMRTQVYN